MTKAAEPVQISTACVRPAERPAHGTCIQQAPTPLRHAHMQGAEFIWIHSRSRHVSALERRRSNGKKKTTPHLCRKLKAQVLFKLRWAPPGEFCFPIYGLAAATAYGSRIKSKQRAVIDTIRTLQGVGGSVGHRPRSNGKRLFSCEFLLAPAAREPEHKRRVDQQHVCGGPRQPVAAARAEVARTSPLRHVVPIAGNAR